MATPMEIVIAVVLFGSFIPGAIVKKYTKKKAEKLPLGESPLKNKTENIISISLSTAFSVIFGFIAPFFLIFDVYHLLLDWASLSFLITSSELLLGLQIFGVCLYVIGYIIYVIGRYTLGEHFAEIGRPGRIGEDFVQTGIFRNWRHPLYTGGFIFSFGLIIAFQTWFGLLLFIYPVIVTIKAAFAEERWLIERFGEKYEQYMKRSWRFFPKLW